MLKFQILWEHF